MTEQDAIGRFTVLYEQTRSRVYAFAVSHAGRQLADEIVSEVYLVAWRRLADIPRPELPWLLAVARNVAAQQFRSTVRQRSIAAELRAWTTEVELTAGDVGEQVAERQAVLAALATLSAPDRDLLTLVAWHGLTPAQAARVVGCSTAAYFVRLHRARRRLERALHARAPDPVDPVGRVVPARPAVLSQPEEGIR